MLKTTFWTLILSQFPYIINTNSDCVPESEILINSKICKCNNERKWTDKDCRPIQRRQMCQPGQVIFQGCNRCICQEDAQIICTEQACSTMNTSISIHESLMSILPWCNSFSTYYISCYVCFCPASGKTADARCALDSSCNSLKEPTETQISFGKISCMPKVMYLFPCLHCICSDEGYFVVMKCIHMCIKNEVTELSHRCIPRKLYRVGCNVCLCPDNSFPDPKLCTNVTCDEFRNPDSNYLRTIEKPANCTPHLFIDSKCSYCECGVDGKVDKKTCLELPCLEFDSLKSKMDGVSESCSPGEMIYHCSQCLCPRTGIFSKEYCSKSCSYQSKLLVLEKIMNSSTYTSVINIDAIQRTTGDQSCVINSIYKEQGRVCVCPVTGITNFNLCVRVNKTQVTIANITVETRNKTKISINFTAPCEPQTFVDFDCNSCYCSKNGMLDPKWCTYDDCDSKRAILDLHKVNFGPQVKMIKDTCNAGSIAKVDCNFCICSDSGVIEHRVCTKNNCSTSDSAPTIETFTCDPLQYYEVDCNVCFCPRDGLKNVARCTKYHCEKGFLRSDDCVPGQLFSHECNVCICPPNGNKVEKVCTSHVCIDSIPWQKISQLSETILGNQISVDATRNLDLCFPGEEFIQGCKLCVCTDVGMRTYAICSPALCGDERKDPNKALLVKEIETRRRIKKVNSTILHRKPRRLI